MGLIEVYNGDIQGNRVVVLDNMQVKQAIDAGYKGLLMQIGPQGLMGLRRIPDQDTHWDYENTDENTLDTIPQELLGIVVDADITAEDGSYFITVKVSNPNAARVTLNITAKANGASIRTHSIELEKNESEKVILVSGIFSADWVSGATFSAEFFSNGNNLILHGDTYASAVRITKAVTPATTKQLTQTINALQATLQHDSRNLDTVVYAVSNSPKRAQGIAAYKLLPDYDFAEERNFFIQDTPQDAIYFVKYMPNGDTEETGSNFEFFFEKLTKMS